MRGKWSGLACGLALTGVLAASAAAQEQAAESEWTRPDVAKAVWLDPVEEMELALSAAPQDVALGATVFVLGNGRRVRGGLQSRKHRRPGDDSGAGGRSIRHANLACGADGPSDFLVLLHGNAGASELAVEARSWRDLQYTNWADSLLGTGRLVRADDLSADSGQGVWANGDEDPGEAWFPGSWAVPTRSYVVKAWDYDQALDIARTSPHLAFGGSVTVRQIADGP